MKYNRNVLEKRKTSNESTLVPVPSKKTLYYLILLLCYRQLHCTASACNETAEGKI